MHEFNLSFAVISFIVVSLTFIYKKLKQSWISEPLVAMFCGIVLSPSVLNVIDIKQWGSTETVMDISIRLTLAMSLMATAFRIPLTYLWKNKSVQAVLLFVVMPLMCVTAAVIMHFVLRLDWLYSLLLGAILMPTDPVLAGSIVTGDKAEKMLPERVRDTISFEAGANDGLTFPFVVLFMFLIQKPDNAWGDWLLQAVLQKTIGAIAFGLAVGYVAGVLLNICLKKNFTGKPAVLAFALAVSFFTLTAGELIGVNSILSIFIAGLTMNQKVNKRQDFQAMEIQDMMSRLFIIPIFIFFGLIIPWHEWFALGWKAIGVVVLIIFLRRLPYLLLFKPFLKGFTTKQRAFMGWFGPIGVAALFYTFYTYKELHTEAIWTICSLIIFSSVIVYGVTASPFLDWYNKARQEAADNTANVTAGEKKGG